jgi:hypothetical protein
MRRTYGWMGGLMCNVLYAGKPPKPRLRSVNSNQQELLSRDRPRRVVKQNRPYSPPPADVPQLLSEELKRKQKMEASAKRRGAHWKQRVHETENVGTPDPMPVHPRDTTKTVCFSMSIPAFVLECPAAAYGQVHGPWSVYLLP